MRCCVSTHVEGMHHRFHALMGVEIIVSVSGSMLLQLVQLLVEVEPDRYFRRSTRGELIGSYMLCEGSLTD